MRMVEGIIVEVKPGKMQAKVRLDAHCDSDGNAMVTDWLQIGFTGPDMHYSYRKDDYVGCIMDDTLDDGWIICRLYKESDNLDSTEQKSVFKFKDKTQVEVDEAQGKVTLSVGDAPTKTEIIITGSSVEIKAAGQLTFPVVHANSPCPVFGGCHINPSNTVKVSL